MNTLIGFQIVGALPHAGEEELGAVGSHNVLKLRSVKALKVHHADLIAKELVNRFLDRAHRFPITENANSLVTVLLRPARPQQIRLLADEKQRSRDAP